MVNPSEINCKAVANEINYDIETGVYVDFPILKNRLEKIAHILVKKFYIVNTEISNGAILCLKENDYLDKFIDYEN